MRRVGFTLLELLVVIGVLALLAGLSLPALQKAKNRGRDVLCMSRLRQIHQAIEIYTGSNDRYPYGFFGKFGYDTRIGDNTYDWTRGWWWFRFLDDFHHDDRDPLDIDPLWCPARRVTDPAMADNVLCGNYGVNYGICKITLGGDPEFTGDPLRPGTIRSPGSTLLALDAGYTLAAWKMFAPDAAAAAFENPGRQNCFYAPGADVNDARSIHPAFSRDAVAGRHGRNACNAAFIDGHVEHKAVQALAPAFDSQGIATQKSPWKP